MATATRKKPEVVKPARSADEIRAELGDFRAEVVVGFPKSILEGSLDAVTRSLNGRAKANGIDGGAWEVKCGSEGYGRYRHDAWRLVGSRPYTDAELLKDSAKILARKARVEETAKKRRFKEIEKYNALASKLGQPLIEG